MSNLPGKTLPFCGFEWMLARRYLGSKRKETFISVISVISFIGIMLGVATLIIVMAVMNGFRAELLDRILGINGHFVISPAHRDLTDYSDVSRRIETVDGVVMALSVVEGQVLASGSLGGSGAYVRGISETDLNRLSAVGDNIITGTLEGFDSGDGVAIGTRMASSLGLAIGDSITLIAPEGNVTAFGVSPRVKAYPVTAIFQIGMSEYDNTLLFMPFGEAELYFNQSGASLIEVFLDDPDKVGILRDAVESSAGRPIFIGDWRLRNRTFFEALQVERNVMFLILTLIILVASLNIVSGLFMLVKDKSRDIAILRTIGVTRGSVLRIFFVTGASVGTIGTLVGGLLGVLVTYNIAPIQRFLDSITGINFWDPTIRFLSEIPARLDPVETGLAILMGLGLSFLATLFPAWRAARLDPVEALRYE